MKKLIVFFLLFISSNIYSQKDSKEIAKEVAYSMPENQAFELYKEIVYLQNKAKWDAYKRYGPKNFKQSTSDLFLEIDKGREFLEEYTLIFIEKYKKKKYKGKKKHRGIRMSKDLVFYLEIRGSKAKWHKRFKYDFKNSKVGYPKIK